MPQRRACLAYTIPRAVHIEENLRGLLRSRQPRCPYTDFLTRWFLVLGIQAGQAEAQNYWRQNRAEANGVSQAVEVKR